MTVVSWYLAYEEKKKHTINWNVQQTFVSKYRHEKNNQLKSINNLIRGFQIKKKIQQNFQTKSVHDQITNAAKYLGKVNSIRYVNLWGRKSSYKRIIYLHIYWLIQIWCNFFCIVPMLIQSLLYTDLFYCLHPCTCWPIKNRNLCQLVVGIINLPILHWSIINHLPSSNL